MTLTGRQAASRKLSRDELEPGLVDEIWWTANFSPRRYQRLWEEERRIGSSAAHVNL